MKKLAWDVIIDYYPEDRIQWHHHHLNLP